MLVDTAARDVELLRRIQCERGVPDPRNDSQQKLNLPEAHSRRLRRRRWLEVKYGT